MVNGERKQQWRALSRYSPSGPFPPSSRLRQERELREYQNWWVDGTVGWWSCGRAVMGWAREERPKPGWWGESWGSYIFAAVLDSRFPLLISSEGIEEITGITECRFSCQGQIFPRRVGSRAWLLETVRTRSHIPTSKGRDRGDLRRASD